jgi:hypothetical protein
MSGGGSNIAGLSASDARTVMGLGTLATVNGGTGVATFLATPTSANLRAAVTDETGIGSLVFATSPTLTTPNIGVATSTRIGIGRAAAAATPLITLSGAGVISAEFINNGNQSTGGGAGMSGYHDNGAAMLDGNRIAFYAFGGAIDSAGTLARPVIISSFAEGNWSASASGAGLTIATTLAGTNTRTDKFHFRGNGNLGIGTTSFGGGVSSVIAIANATTVPSSNPVGGGVLYVEGGALKYRGSSGTITTIAPA